MTERIDTEVSFRATFEQAEQRARESERRFEELFEQSPAAFELYG